MMDEEREVSFYCRKNQVRGRSIGLEICTFQEAEEAGNLSSRSGERCGWSWWGGGWGGNGLGGEVPRRGRGQLRLGREG